MKAMALQRVLQLGTAGRAAGWSTAIIEIAGGHRCRRGQLAELKALTRETAASRAIMAAAGENAEKP
jgi:hypothetical protein